MKDVKLGKYLTLESFCTCTQTYQKYTTQINPYPDSTESVVAIQALNQWLIDPIIDHFGLERFHLTYGFCSKDLKRFLEKKDPITGLKNGRVAPHLDQHIAHEVKKNGRYYCERLGAACDCQIKGLDSSEFVDWIIAQKLPFDSLYFYSQNRPIHLSYGPQNKGDIWTFNAAGLPTKKGTERWKKEGR
ncbi:hypothetical protein [Lyngbya sp. PCC 8106]|uniref:hypothetical protein n=1 Tax=Lyngbya sp. (strain PCC 8106) TaxID=313612 RepID=UPI0000EAA05A|nr:hypothetical protein [Lyngbya sp. PCC 8106]EAW34570.1 hypothetical protein L8106_14135 [Lyngbya sp. PCC 8106]